MRRGVKRRMLLSCQGRAGSPDGLVSRFTAPREETPMAATACTMLAEIRLREFQSEVARLRLSQAARNDGSITTGALARFRSQWRASAERALQQLALISWTARTSRRGAFSS